MVDEALEQHEAALGRAVHEQGDLFADLSAEPKRVAIGRDEAKATLLDRLESFLAKHTSGDDLGLRLRGEQLAAGVRFVRLVREGTYDLVVANPPYQGTSKMADTKYVTQDVPARQGRPLRGVPAARAGTGARGRRVGDAHDAELDVHQAVRRAAGAPAGDSRLRCARRLRSWAPSRGAERCHCSVSACSDARDQLKDSAQALPQRHEMNFDDRFRALTPQARRHPLP